MVEIPNVRDAKIAVVGLGYVGLPLAVHLGRHFKVTGFDINSSRVAVLREGKDPIAVLTADETCALKHLSFSSEVGQLQDANIYIVAVPTPTDAAKRPDLSAVKHASELVGRVLSAGNVVVYESTVYPGATEEICVPLLESQSQLAFNKDFFVGYSPERINPGDPHHGVRDVVKVVSGSTVEARALIDSVYRTIVPAGTCQVSSIRVAEAAKVIENIQRDVNIALINELGMLFKKMGLETREILQAAATKWNFHSYRPGLVGGHCIGVDPYYLTHKAQTLGFHPEMILAGRRINDGMASFVARDIVSVMLRRHIDLRCARVLVLGFTFKENVPDVRNSKVADLVRELSDFVDDLVVWDPHADPGDVDEQYGRTAVQVAPEGHFDVVVVAVAHQEFRDMGGDGIRRLLNGQGDSFIYDVTGLLPISASDFRL